MNELICPSCGAECCRDEADVGVGVIYGPWGCYSCGWSESPLYDSSEGKSPEQVKHSDCYVDPCGGLTPITAIADKLEHFGLPRTIADEVFG